MEYGTGGSQSQAAFSVLQSIWRLNNSVFLSVFSSCRLYFFAIHVHDSHEFSEVRIALAIKKLVRISFTLDCVHSSNSLLRHPYFLVFLGCRQQIVIFSSIQLVSMGWRRKPQCHNFSEIRTSEQKCNRDRTFQA